MLRAIESEVTDYPALRLFLTEMLIAHGMNWWVDITLYMVPVQRRDIVLMSEAIRVKCIISGRDGVSYAHTLRRLTPLALEVINDDGCEITLAGIDFIKENGNELVSTTDSQ